MGYLAAVKRFLEVMAMVWAGSQVTKLLRAGGALALAPTVDRGLSWFTDKFKFDSQVKLVIVGFCLGLAFLMFLVVTIPWAQRFSLLSISSLSRHFQQIGGEWLLSYAFWKSLSSWTARDTHGWDAKHYAGINLA